MLESLHLNTVLSTATIYIFIVVCIRILGKNELSQLSITDLVFVLLLSNAVQNAMVGSDTTLLGGILAATTLFLVNKLLAYLLYKSPTFTKLMDGEPVVLVRHGKLNQKEMKRNQLTLQNLEQAARNEGIGDIKTIDVAILEVDGKISFLSDDKLSKATQFLIDEKKDI